MPVVFFNLESNRLEPIIIFERQSLRLVCPTCMLHCTERHIQYILADETPFCLCAKWYVHKTEHQGGLAHTITRR